MGLFIRLTLGIAAAIIALFVLAILFKVFVVAAAIAAVLLAAFFTFHFVRGLLRPRGGALTR